MDMRKRLISWDWLSIRWEVKPFAVPSVSLHDFCLPKHPSEGLSCYASENVLIRALSEVDLRGACVKGDLRRGRYVDWAGQRGKELWI